ncbi:MAG: NAD(P)-dependent oxidoreductase [Bacteroidetes bacterium]|nr:NAD(P)-dependent oxidoreductase [Bacteroidota bacterium]
MKRKTNLLLTGASGTVGHEVLEQLCKNLDNYQITAFDKESRRSVKLFSRYKEKVEIVYGDITDKDCMYRICSGKDVVIHLAAIIPPFADDHPDLAYQVNTVGTQNLIKGLETYSPDAFLLYSSSISVYGDRLNDPLIKVGDPLIPSVGDEYAKTKIKAEDAIKNSRISWCIFRLSGVMGKHKMSKLMFHMPLRTPMEITTPKDTARAFINSINKRDSLSGKIFNLGGGENMRLTYRDLLSRSFAIMGLGSLDFPKNSFAERNFHCGFYLDGDTLDHLIEFREATLESYFSELEHSISSIKRILIKLLRRFIKSWLLKHSEPLNAVLTEDATQIHHFFGDRS